MLLLFSLFSSLFLLANAIPKHHHHQKLSTVHEDTNLPFILGLRVPNQSDLDAFLADVYDPESPNYHQFLQPAEFHKKFSPKPHHVERVKSLLTKSNLEFISISQNHFLLEARGQVKHINQFFNCVLEQYLHAEHGYVFISPKDDSFTLPTEEILSVIGLDNSTLPRRSSKARKLANFPLGPTGIRKMYNFPSNFDGTGQTIALVEYDNFLDSDITKYASTFGISSPQFSRVLINPTCAECCSSQACQPCNCIAPPSTPGSGAGEVVLDIEVALAVAPKAKILVYIGANSATIGVINQIAQDNTARQVSTSWGFTENEIFPSFKQFAILEGQIFQQMAAQGQSFFAATGDFGAFGDAKNNPTQLIIQDPSGQPFVTAVGGTTISLDSAGNRISETTWFDTANSPPSGGGGGISVFWPLPSYQTGMGTTANKGSTTMRMVPDVSLDSDPNTGYAVILNGNLAQFGGTSAAAPIWAAFIALVNQYRVGVLGQSSVGFVNPTVYGLQSQWSFMFNDIADNSNNGFFPAVAGYDLSTGLGTIKGSGMFFTLGGCANGLPASGGTCGPTASPTAATVAPTFKPTTATVTNGPSKSPTKKPISSTQSPSLNPTKKPITATTGVPSLTPTKKPVTATTGVPSLTPTKKPVTATTAVPSLTPTKKPIVPVTANPTTLTPTKPPTTTSTTTTVTSSPTFHTGSGVTTLAPTNSIPTTLSPTKDDNSTSTTDNGVPPLNSPMMLGVIIGSSVGGLLVLGSAAACFVRMNRRKNELTSRRPLTFYTENPIFQRV